MALKYISRSTGACLVALMTVGGVRELLGQGLQIGIIDFYGLKRVSAVQVRDALTFKVGDTLSLTGERQAALTESEIRLSKLPGVARAHTNVVCCEQGRAIVFVGIQEDDAGVVRVRAAPRGAARLADDIVSAGKQFSDGLIAAVQRGDVAEDRSPGHALNHDTVMRAVQERFIAYAARDLSQLRLVLRDSSDDEHRALAAQVLGYVADKQAVVGDLVAAMNDPAETVRNNAMRTLVVFAETVQTATRPVPRVPYRPFIVWLNSPVWSDRNKASGALVTLSRGRDPELLASLAREAMSSLVEMARWKSAPHAMAAFEILGRVAGLTDDAAQNAWDRGERETVISAALEREVKVTRP